MLSIHNDIQEQQNHQEDILLTYNSQIEVVEMMKEEENSYQRELSSVNNNNNYEFSLNQQKELKLLEEKVKTHKK
jgi:hypothetical protein